MKKNIWIVGLFICIFCLYYACTNKTQIGKLEIPRAGHSAIYLPLDNKILFVGGGNEFTITYLHNAELFNLATNKIEAVIQTSLPHALPTLYLNSNNELVLVDNNGIELFDNKNNKFNLIVKNPFSIDNYLNSMQNLKIDDDIILITGGEKNGEPITNSYLYNIKSKQFVKKFNMNVPRTNHRMVISNKNEIYIIGGRSNTPENERLVEKYNRKTQKFDIVGKIKEARMNYTIYPYKNSILLIGGLTKNNMEIYDLNKNSSSIDKSILNIKNISSVPNQNLEIIDIKDNKLKFIYKNNIKGCSGIYVYDFNTKKSKRIKVLSIGSYTNILQQSNGYIILSGGEKQYSNLIKMFVTKICTNGKLCLSAVDNKIVLQKLKRR